MKKNDLKKLTEKISETITKSLPDDLKINESKTGKTIIRHLKHLLKKLNAQNLKEKRKADKAKKKKAPAKKSKA